MKTDIVEDLRLHKDSFHWRAADEIERLRAENEKLRDGVRSTIQERDVLSGENWELRAENEKLRANFTMLADAVRAAKEAASYNRHKMEHCVSRSIWSALSDQEKYARKALAESAAAALKETGDE